MGDMAEYLFAGAVGALQGVESEHQKTNEQSRKMTLEGWRHDQEVKLAKMKDQWQRERDEVEAKAKVTAAETETKAKVAAAETEAKRLRAAASTEHGYEMKEIAAQSESREKVAGIQAGARKKDATKDEVMADMSLILSGVPGADDLVASSPTEYLQQLQQLLKVGRLKGDAAERAKAVIASLRTYQATETWKPPTFSEGLGAAVEGMEGDDPLGLLQ